MLFGSLSNRNPLECVSMNHQECKVWPEVLNVNCNEPLFYPFNIKTSKCSGSCYNRSLITKDSHAKLCVPDVVKNLNINVFNLISRTNETRLVKWHETCKCKCGLDASVCNNKQPWNEDKCICECKELIDKVVYNKRFIWNLSNCECECDKLCDISEYLDYSNCKWRKILVDKLVEECIKSIDEIEITEIAQTENKCSSRTLYLVLLLLFLTTSIVFCFLFFFCLFLLVLKKRYSMCFTSYPYWNTKLLKLINGKSQAN